MATLELRPGIIDRLRNLHGITSDEAFAQAVGVSHRTLSRSRSEPKKVQPALIAGICEAFGYSPNDVVRVVADKNHSHAA